jgi:hypothetical protein
MHTYQRSHCSSIFTFTHFPSKYRAHEENMSFHHEILDDANDRKKE